MVVSLTLFVLDDMHSNDPRVLRAYTLVILELACWNLLLKHLVDFFEGAILGLWNHKEDKDEYYDIRTDPDVSVFSTLRQSDSHFLDSRDDCELTQFSSKGFKK